MRATHICQELRASSMAYRATLVAELQSLYPQYRFTWDDNVMGLRIHMPTGSIRLPRAVWHAAYSITQSNGPSGKFTYLKNKGVESAPDPPPPRTWFERLCDE